MAQTVKNLVPSKYAENAQTTQYTATNCKTLITKFTVSNPTASNQTIAVNLVASGGSASAANLTQPTKTVSPGQTFEVVACVGRVLEAGAFISTLAGASSSLVIDVSGVEIT